jgi:hypothetical protein
MLRHSRFAGLALAGLLAIASPASAHDVRLEAHLTADAEVPDPGPAGASGHATVTVNGDNGSVCYDVSYTGPGTVTLGHIHRGAAGVAGDVVVDLKVMANTHKACVQGDPGFVQAIETSPETHYVNLHTAEYGAGAVRGQLQPAG